MLSIASISGAYTVLQLLFAVYFAIKGKRLIRNGYLPEFDLFGDKVLNFTTELLLLFTIITTLICSQL